MEVAVDLSPIWQDVLAQAVTGELIAAMNYTDLANICDASQEAAEARAHASIERGHAAAFQAAGRDIGVDVQSNVDAKHWKHIREAFRRRISERDIVACLIIQEIMLESFAVASYARVARVANGKLGKTFAAIAVEEEEHVHHAMEILRTERALNERRFDEKVHELHFDVMATLARMLTKECKDGHCEVCHGSCVKPSLFEVRLSAAELRGASLQQYLKTLDMLGLPGEVTLTWLAQLPV
jgi:fatty aldehyde decarbonylase